MLSLSDRRWSLRHGTSLGECGRNAVRRIKGDVHMTKARTMRSKLPTATVWDTLSFAGGVIIPTMARGAIIRRPKMVALAERLNLDQRAVRRVQALRDKYGTGPLLLCTTRWYPRAVVLAPAHVQS